MTIAVPMGNLAFPAADPSLRQMLSGKKRRKYESLLLWAHQQSVRLFVSVDAQVVCSHVNAYVSVIVTPCNTNFTFVFFSDSPAYCLFTSCLYLLGAECPLELHVYTYQVQSVC